MTTFPARMIFAICKWMRVRTWKTTRCARTGFSATAWKPAIKCWDAKQVRPSIAMTALLALPIAATKPMIVAITCQTMRLVTMDNIATARKPVIPTSDVKQAARLFVTTADHVPPILATKLRILARSRQTTTSAMTA